MPKLLDTTYYIKSISALCIEMQTKTDKYLAQLLDSRNEQIEYIEPFVSFISSRVKTIMELANNENIIDGEIILRSMLEAFFKYSYVVLPEKQDEVKNRINEFYTIIPEINMYWDSIRTQLMLNDGQPQNATLILRNNVLTEKEKGIIADRYNIKSKKDSPIEKALDSQWAFGTLVNRFGNKDIYKGLLAFQPIEMKSHWVQASHFSHEDSSAFKFVIERSCRQATERSNSNLMHVTKLMRLPTVYHLWTALILADFLSMVEIKEEILNAYFPVREQLQQMGDMIRREVESASMYGDAKTPQNNQEE